MADPPKLEFAGEEIQVSDREKLLGVHIDSTLSWAYHVEATLRKCNSLLYLLDRIEQYLSIPIRKLFYNAYILPHLDYCCTIWGNANIELMHSVVKFKKKKKKKNVLQSQYYTNS